MPTRSALSGPALSAFALAPCASRNLADFEMFHLTNRRFKGSICLRQPAPTRGPVGHRDCRHPQQVGAASSARRGVSQYECFGVNAADYAVVVSFCACHRRCAGHRRDDHRKRSLPGDSSGSNPGAQTGRQYGSAALLDSNRKVHLAWREYCPDVRGVSRACRVVRDCADLTAVSHGADQIYRHVRRLPAGACNHYG